MWSLGAKGFFIDSILGGYPIPPIHIRYAPDPELGTVREVIDGQQRVRAIFEFIEGSFKVPKASSEQWGGKSFGSLTPGQRDKIRLFSFNVYLYKSLEDAEVLEVFARLNQYSVKLNKQELRNGKWFGAFKRTSFALAGESIEFWRHHRVFSETQIARMREAEFTSELLAAVLDGMQDGKKSLDSFYEELDPSWGRKPVEPWPVLKSAESRMAPHSYMAATVARGRFNKCLSAINLLGDAVSASPFRRPALFYTLFCLVYHLLYGLPRFDGPLGGAGLDADASSGLRQVLGEVSEALSSGAVHRDELLQAFQEGAARQTDNIGPRTLRLEALLGLLEQNLRDN